MEQYSSPSASSSVVPDRIELSNSRASHENSHLASLVHRLMETVDKQSRQIARLESTISEVRSTIRNRSE
jgi:hypothetical protein